MGSVTLGCSGWDYAEWVGRFYPANRTVDRLAYYARQFPLVEVDSSFYRTPTAHAVESWARRTPKGFRFTAKLPQEATHERRLVGAGPALRRHAEAFRPLVDAGKLVANLVQLPPSLPFDATVARAFYEELPPEVPAAVEFRERSWLAAASWELLREFRLAAVVVDEPLLPVDLTVTRPDLAYVRLHGFGSTTWYDYTYSPAELLAWVPRLKDLAERAERVVVLFNNHFRGDAPVNALELARQMDLPPPPWASTLGGLERAVPK